MFLIGNLLSPNTLERPMTEKIAIIGAGITGVTTAYKLSDSDAEVTVFERNRYAAMETSFANGGQLSASNAEVWNNWSTVWKGLHWMLRADAPLLMNPKPNLHKLSWMLGFLSNIKNYRQNTIKTTEMAIAAREHLLEMAAEAGVDFDYRPCGILHFYQDEKGFKHARAVNKLLAKGGLERKELGPNDIQKYEPNLEGQFAGGFWTQSDSTGDIHKLSIGLAAAALARAVRFCYDSPIERLSATQRGVLVQVEGQDPQEFDKIVICAGVHSHHFAKMLGDRVNVYPVKGYSITVNMKTKASQAAAPQTSLLDDAAKVVTSRLGRDRFRIAGTAEFNGINRDIRADRIAPLVQWCEQYFPGVSTEHVVPWAGLRPMRPNMMPRVGAGKNPNVFYNTGHGHLGWTLSGITADMVASLTLARRAA